MITIVNHGLGNFRSVISAIEHLKRRRYNKQIRGYKKIIKNNNSCVGSFKYAMQNLKN